MAAGLCIFPAMACPRPSSASRTFPPACAPAAQGGGPVRCHGAAAMGMLALALIVGCGPQAPYGCEETVSIVSGTVRLSGRFWSHNTGVFIHAGDRLRVDAFGSIRLADDVRVDPQGTFEGIGGLYLRVGELMVPRLAGENFYGAFSDTGTLYFITPEEGPLYCEKEHFVDNTGFFDVTVEVLRAAR